VAPSKLVFVWKATTISFCSVWPITEETTFEPWKTEEDEKPTPEIDSDCSSIPNPAQSSVPLPEAGEQIPTSDPVVKV